ncbi:aminotransferase class V-fold PLP-dependent enzyme [Azospirillum sp. YIM DDC1]|uniref:Cysteine desulfurase n=1 Tax=Azospirillum aestuarii TaxID=2802052 RepID=A0ABS1HS15_9PROT|nr:aminotransferase class V-fold PLP-dependent enzyme [Azospirillum aestuarii]MBK4717536.1 aminotransferase class V-fold PLP-dependent enzyme [Azospirillum aestuarii]
MHGPTYLDCNATTPLDPEVRDEMLRMFDIEYGNPGSRTHAFGAKAKVEVNDARQKVAAVVGANPEDVVFTSGATESNNIAIFGLAKHGRAKGLRRIVTTAIEHKSVLEPCAALAAEGFEVVTVAPRGGGRVQVEDVLAAASPDTLLVSVMHVNNETGVVQSVAEIAEGLAGRDCFLHCDAAQGFGKEFEQLRHPGIDLVSVSGHKMYAPKGVGALVMKRRKGRRPPMAPVLVGGGQELGLRPGTLAAPLIVALGKAAEIAVRDRDRRRKACERLRVEALEALSPFAPEVNGDPEHTLPHTLNVSLPGLRSEALMLALKDVIAVSNGSACTSNSYESSHVLKAMGLSPERVAGALRLSWCHMTLSPDWKAVAEGIRLML